MKTTLEPSDPLIERDKRLAAKASTTLCELVDAGLRLVLKERAARTEPFVLRDARVNGRGLSPEFQAAAWGDMRNAGYEGRGRNRNV